MIGIFQHIDLSLDYEYILKCFLDKEHVESEREWVELYCQINNTSEEYAYQRLSKELTTYSLIVNVDNEIYFNSIKEKLGDTSCICMTRDEVFYEKSFQKNIEREFSKIMKIDYDQETGFLFITGIRNSSSIEVCVYSTITEHAESLALKLLPMRRGEVSEKEFEKKQKLMIDLWSDAETRIPFMEKVGITLKFVDHETESDKK